MSEVFDGTVEVQDGTGNTTVLVDGNRGALYVGAGGQDGTIHVHDAAGTARIFLDAEGSIVSRDAAAASIVTLTGDGQIYIRRLLAADYITVLQFLPRRDRWRSAARARAAVSRSGTAMATTPSLPTGMTAT
jgi:hypothetical protein